MDGAASGYRIKFYFTRAERACNMQHMAHISRKFRAYPTEDQKALLARTFGAARFVWNSILDWRGKQYAINGVKINYVKSAARLTEMKNSGEFPWLCDVSAVALQQSLRSQDKAFSNFFAKKSRYPRFKSKRSAQSVRLMSNAFRIKDGDLFISKSYEPFRIVKSRELPCNISSITISLDAAGRYFVSFCGEMPLEKLPFTEKTVGIDLGITSFITTSDGMKVPGINVYRKFEKRIARAQRRYSRKVKGSKNRDKERKKTAVLYAKTVDIRTDFLHKLSTQIIRDNQTVAIEDLNVAGMMGNKCLSKSIADASWAEFTRQLEYKAEWYGREIIKVSRWYPSSQICSNCGYRDGKKELSVRNWICAECGAIHDRDVNAAININTAGLAEINDCQL